MELFIHIGYPKCLSTTLQRNFFDKHTEINFLGVGKNDNVSYVNKKIEFVNENILKYSSDFLYKKYKSECCQAIKKTLCEKKINVISNEYLSLKFSTQEIDSILKLKRLYKLCKIYNPSVVFITRNPLDIINSLFKEYVRLGYPKTYNEFIIWLWNYRDRNFFYDLLYSKKERELKSIFGADRVQYFKYEDIVNKPEKFINDNLSKYFGINNQNLSLDKHNMSLSNEETVTLLNYNKSNPRNFGAPAYSSPENHRNRVWFEKSNAIIDEYNIYKNVYQKRTALAEIAEIAEKSVVGEYLFTLNCKGEKALKNILYELKDE